MSGIEGSAIGALATEAWKSPELLRELYGDLAKPGVSQVGKALETILETGCLALLPLRLLNQKAKAWEQKNFADFAERLANEKIDEVSAVRPEIGVPILERLSNTIDPDLRNLFINLLASSSLDKKSENCHPSFAHIVSLLSPDEARLLRYWQNTRELPFLSIAKALDERKIQEVRKFYVYVPSEIQFPNNIEIYLNNMSGLGIINYTTDSWLSNENIYLDLIKSAKSEYPGIMTSALQSISLGTQYPDSYTFYEKGVIKIQPYGKLLQQACL